MSMLDLSRLFFRISAYARGKWAEEMRPLSVFACAYTKKNRLVLHETSLIYGLHLLTKQIPIVSNILGTVNLAHRHLGRICQSIFYIASFPVSPSSALIYFTRDL